MSPWTWHRWRFAWTSWDDTGNYLELNRVKWVRVTFGLWWRSS